jgi:hypothetical protein
MALPDLTGQNIQNTYQRVLQTDGINVLNGTGSLFIPPTASYAVTASYAEYAVSASHEIIKEVSSSYADYAKESGLATSSISASYAETASYALNSIDTFPYTGSAVISGSLTLTGSFNALLPTSSTDTYFVTYNTSSYELEARQVATLINPKVEYLDVTASISSGTSITLPNELSYISSSTYEYLEVFFNGLRLRYDRDFVPTSTTTIQNQIAFPSGSELTFKSLKA